MQIVSERTMAPRPLQRPSDVERHPIDFGIEPSPPPPQKPEATIIKSAISREPDPAPESTEPKSTEIEPPPKSVADSDNRLDDEWGEGIL